MTAFWTFLIQRFVSSQIIPENYQFNLLIALGLMPDSPRNHCQMIFCLLLARPYIWICKNNKTLPKVEGLFRCLKSTYLFEQKGAGKFCNKLVALKNSLLPCYFANYYDSDASILRELKKKAFFRGILFEFTDNVPISCGKCNFGKTQNILESVLTNEVGTTENFNLENRSFFLLLLL